MGNKKNRIAGLLGLFSALLFSISLIIFGNLHPTFDFLNDFVSKLGAKGAPHAIWWNTIGFGIVGILLTGFGILYGSVLEDKFAGILLAFFGIGFAFTAIPMDMAAAESTVSKAHIVAICLALAFWLFGLARIASNQLVGLKVPFRANVTALLIVGAMIGFVIGLWSMPVTHRLVFLLVFGWTLITAIDLLKKQEKI